MTFISTTEPEQEGIVTFDQHTKSDIFFEDNELTVTGDITILGTVKCNFINDIFTKTKVEAKNVFISDTLSGKKVTVNNTTINNNNLKTSTIDCGLLTTTKSLKVGSNTTISTNLSTNKFISDILKANTIKTNIFEIDAEKNIFKLTDLSTDTVSSKNLNLETTKFLNSSIKTKDFTADTITINDTSNGKLSAFSNIDATIITAEKFLSTNFSTNEGSISTQDIVITNLNASSLNVYDNIPSLEISKKFTIGSKLTNNNIVSNFISGTTVKISGEENLITGTGAFFTNTVNVSGDVFATKLISDNSDLTFTGVSFLNGASLFNSVLDFKSINDLNIITGSLNNNASAIDSNINVKEITLSGDTTITKLTPNKIIVNEINADTINNTTVDNTLLTTHKFTGKDFTFSGPISLTNIKSSRTLNIDANVDIETTLFMDGDVETYSIITCRVLETPLLTNVTNISSTEHYFEDSIINTVSFDDDGIITPGNYNAPGMTTGNINLNTITNPLYINGTYISNTSITLQDLSASGKISASELDITTTVEAQTAKLHTIETDTVSITSSHKGIASNKMDIDNLKTGSITTSKDLVAKSITHANINHVYKIEVHVVSDVDIPSFPPSGTAGVINGIKIVKGLIVLIKDQIDQTQNGIYVVTDSAWERHKTMLDTTDAAGASVVDSVSGKIYTNTESPCIVSTDNIIFAEYTGVLLGETTINDTTILNNNFNSDNNIYADTVSADTFTTGNLKLSEGLLDITTSSTINGMTTTDDNLNNVVDINTTTLNANDISITDLEVQRIITTQDTVYGGVSFEDSSIDTVVELTVNNQIHTKSIAVENENLNITKNMGNVITKGISVSEGNISVNEIETATALNVKNVSLIPSTGTINFGFPEVYSPLSVYTGIQRTATETNEWFEIPKASVFGLNTQLQFKHQDKLFSTKDLELKETAILSITITSNGYTLKNTINKFVDGVYPYSDIQDEVSFNVNIVSGIVSITDIVIDINELYTISMEIPVQNQILKTTRLKLSDQISLNSNIVNELGDIVIQTPTDFSIRNGIKYNTAKIAERSKLSSITNGTFTLLSDGSFTEIQAPTLGTHPSTKGYTDANIQTFKWTSSADYVYAQNVIGYTNNAFIGINMIYLDGTHLGTLNDGLVVLLIGQTDPVQNGIYTLGTNKTVLTRTVSGNLAGTSTHINFGETKKDAVYVCVGTVANTGIDPCVYTQIIDGIYTYSSELSGGNLLLNTLDFVINDNKLTSTEIIDYAKLSKTGFGIVDNLGPKVLTIGNNVPTIITISNNKSFLDVNESYVSHKNFTHITSDGQINAENVTITGNAISDALPFISGHTMNINNINNLSGLVNYTATNVYTENTTILTDPFSLLLGQTDPSENGFYNYDTKVNYQTPFVVNNRYKVNDNSFIQDIKLNRITSTGNLITPILNSVNLRVPVLSAYDVFIDETKINQNNIIANDMKVETLKIKDTVSIDVDAVTFSNVSLSGTGDYALNTVVLVKNNTDPAENGIYIVKETTWPRLESKFAKDPNEITFRISNNGFVFPFIKKTYDFSNVSSIGSAYTADYYSEKPLHLVGSYVDGIKVSADETVLVKDDGIYKISNQNWIKTNFFQEGEVCDIQKGEKYKQVSFKLVNQKTQLNYDIITDFIVSSNTSLVSSDKPENTKLLLTGQTVENENGLYTVQSDLSLSNIPLVGINSIISLEDLTTLFADDNIFYKKPDITVDYYLKPKNPIVFDTYTDGTSIYQYTVDEVYLKLIDIEPSQYIYISNLQKTFKNGSFVNKAISKPSTFVTISDVQFADNIITGITGIRNTPAENVSIVASKIGTNSLSSILLNSPLVSIPSGKVICKSDNVITDNFTSSEINVKGLCTIENEIYYENININSDIKLNNSIIKQKGTKVSDVIISNTIPYGLTETIAKHGDSVLVLDLGIFTVNAFGLWSINEPKPKGPYFYNETVYTYSETFNNYSAMPVSEEDIHTDVYTKDFSNTNANVDEIKVSGDLFFDTISSSETLNIVNDNSIVNIGMRFLNANTVSEVNIVNLSTIDPLKNAVDAIGRGFINDIQIFKGSNVLLVGQTNASENGLYIVNIDTWTKVDNPSELSFRVNDMYYSSTFVPISINENTKINTETGIIETFTYKTDTSIETNDEPTSGLFTNIGSELTTGSNSTEINIQATDLNVMSSTTTLENLNTTNVIVDKILNVDNITIEGNITTLTLLKFNKSISLNSVDLTNVNDLQVNENISCDSMITPSISHSGSFDIHSVVADTVVENSTLTNKQTIPLPEFNNYAFDGLNIHSNVSAVYTSNAPVLSGEHSGLFDGDIVIVNEPHSNTLDDYTIQISNASWFNEITLSNKIKIDSIVVNTGGYSSSFRQMNTDKVSIALFDTQHNTHGYNNLNKLPINVDISITVFGYAIPESNGVFVVKQDSWSRINNLTIKPVSLDLNYFYKTVNKPIKVILPYKLMSLPTVSKGTVSKLSEDTLIVDINEGYSDEFTKIDSSGTISITDSNKNAVTKNIFTRANKLYIQENFEITEKQWLRINYVVDYDFVLPSLNETTALNINSNIVKTGEYVLLIAQTSVKENGLYLYQNSILFRPDGYDEQDIMNEFIWDSTNGYGYYIFGTLGNFINVQKTNISHPHASDKIIFDKLITNEIICPLPNIDIFKSAPKISMDLDNITAENIDLTDAFLITPNLFIKGTLSSLGNLKLNNSITINQKITSQETINVSSKQNVILNGLTIGQNSTDITNMVSNKASIKIIDTDVIKNLTSRIKLPDFEFYDIKLRAGNLNTVLEEVPKITSTTIDTAVVMVDRINTLGSILFSDENSIAMRIIGSSIDIPKMTLSKIESSINGPTNTSVFTNATGFLNTFTSAQMINVNTVAKTTGYNSTVKINAKNLQMNAKELLLNRSMNNNTQNLLVYGNITVKKINSSKNLKIGGNGGNVFLGQDFFNISNKLNTINFTTDLELDSFLGKAKGVSIGDRINTNTLSLDTSNQIILKGKNINISYLEDVPAFKWQPNVSVISDYPIDLTKPLYILNKTTVVPDMTILITANVKDNGVYKVNGNNTLTKLSKLELAYAYTEKFGNQKSFYVSEVSKSISNQIEQLTLSTVPLFTPTNVSGSYTTVISGDISNAEKISIEFTMSMLNRSIGDFPGIYFNNNHRISYIRNGNYIQANFAGNNHVAKLQLPESEIILNKEYTVRVIFDLNLFLINIFVKQLPTLKSIYTITNEPSEFEISNFDNSYLIGYDNSVGSGISNRTFKNGTIKNFSITIPDTTDIPVNKTYFIKDQTMTTNTQLYVDYMNSHYIIFNFTVKCTQINASGIFVSSNGNKIFYDTTGFKSLFKEYYTENDLISFVNTPLQINTLYEITCIFDYSAKTTLLTVNGQTGSLVNASEQKRFNNMSTTFAAPDLENAEIKLLNIYTNGYAPVIPNVINVSDKLRIVNKYIPTSESVQIIKTGSSLLDRRAEITITPGKYTVEPKLVVKSSNEFMIINLGTPIKQNPIEYFIKLFDYSRTDIIQLASTETNKSFIFTSTKYKFDLSLESVNFNFEGHPELAFTGELIDSFNTIRKNGYTNFNTWIINVKRITTSLTEFNFDLNYDFTVREYPKTITPSIAVIPNKTYNYDVFENEYKLSQFSPTDHQIEPLYLKPQKPTFGYDNLTYTKFDITSLNTKVNGTIVNATVIRDNSLFKMTRIPNIYNLKSGIFTPSPPTTKVISWFFEEAVLTPDNTFDTYFRLRSNNAFNSSDYFKNVKIMHAEKYRIVPVVGYPTIEGNEHRGNIYYTLIDQDGNLVEPGETLSNIKLCYIKGVQKIQSYRKHGATIQVFPDFIFISVDKQNINNTINIPIKNQPEFSFSSLPLTFKPRQTDVQIISYDNEILEGTSILYNNVFNTKIYKIPNTKDYAPGIYTDYKFNKSQGLKRTTTLTNLNPIFRFHSTYRLFYANLYFGKGVIIEDLSVVLDSDKRMIIIPQVVDNYHVYLFAFPEDGTISNTINIPFTLNIRISFIEINFDISESNTFEFELPTDVRNLTTNFDYNSLTIPGSIVDTSSIQLIGNKLSGSVIPSGQKVYQGTYYPQFDGNHLKGRSTGVHITSSYIYFAINTESYLNEPITIPTFKNDYFDLSNVDFKNYQNIIPEITGSQLRIRPRGIPQTTIDTGILYANIQTEAPIKIMSLLPNNIIISALNPIDFKRTLKVNDDIITNGIYDLNKIDKNTETYAFVPERIYSSSGSAKVLYNYKISINNKSQLVIEKKKLNKEVESTDNESFRLTVYKVKKPPQADARRIKTFNNKAIINIPEKKIHETQKLHTANITMNILYGYSEMIYITPVEFEGFVSVKFSNVERTIFGCEKISRNEFKITVYSTKTKKEPTVFQAVFVEKHIPITNTVNDYINTNGFWTENFKFETSNNEIKTKSKLNECITYVYNESENVDINVITQNEGKVLYTSSIPKSLSTDTIHVKQYLTTALHEKGMIVYENKIKSDAIILNGITTNISNIWRYYSSSKFIQLPHYNDPASGIHQTFYFFENSYMWQSDSNVYFHPQNWCIIGFGRKYIVISENTLNSVYNKNHKNAFIALSPNIIEGETVYQDPVEMYSDKEYTTLDTLTDQGISISIEKGTNTLFRVNTSNSTFDPETYMCAAFTVFYKKTLIVGEVKAIHPSGLYYNDTTRLNVVSRTNVENDFVQPNVLKRIIINNVMILELDESFTGLVRYTLGITQPTIFTPSPDKAKQIKSISNTFSNNNKTLINFKNTNPTTYTSVYAVPYPSTFNTDFFNVDINLMASKPTLTVKGINVNNVPAYPGKDIALETFITTRKVLVFRMTLQSSTSDTFLNIENYPELLTGEKFNFKVENIGPLNDSSYVLKNKTHYHTFARIDTIDKKLLLFVRSMLGTSWSNQTFWKITILPSTSTFSPVSVEELVE